MAVVVTAAAVVVQWSPSPSEAGEEPPGPTIAVDPRRGLGDFTRVTVRGGGFAAGGRAWVGVCTAVGLDRRCDVGERPTVGADGHFEMDLGGWARFEPVAPGGAEPVDCRREPGCVVYALDEQSGREVEATLRFRARDLPRGRYLDPVFDEVTVEHDVVYRQTTDYQGNPVELSMTIYRPAGDHVRRRPTIVWMHGGWFSGGAPSQMHAYAMASARRGYVAASLEYRLRPEMATTDYPQLYAAMVDAYEDATAGVAWLRAHARRLRIDPSAISAGGWSAGAVTASNLAYYPGQRGPAGSPVAAAVPIAGWFVRPDQPLPIAGPFAVPDRGEPPSIVFHGSDDQLLPWGSPRDLCPLAGEAGVACEYVGFDGAGHDIHVTYRRDVVRRTFDFLAEHVLVPRGHLDESVGRPRRCIRTGRCGVDEVWNR